MMAKQKIAYVSQLVYPHSSANALQAIQMADGFSRNVDTTFFIRGLTLHESKLREMHRIPPAPLRISPAYFNLLPSFAQKWYGSFLGMLFGVHPVWRRNRQQNILFVRRPVDLLFWGAARNRYHWLRDWFFIFEAHDIAGLPPEAEVQQRVAQRPADEELRRQVVDAAHAPGPVPEFGLGEPVHQTLAERDGQHPEQIVGRALGDVQAEHVAQQMSRFLSVAARVEWRERSEIESHGQIGHAEPCRAGRLVPQPQPATGTSRWHDSMAP